MNDQTMNFNGVWFSDVVNKYMEGPRYDLKLTWKEKLSTEEDTFKLVKPILALANISYRTGKKCFLLFGVDDDHKIKGINQDEFEYPLAAKVKDEIKKSESLLKKMDDGVLKIFQEQIVEWISPDIPDLELEFGFVPDYKGDTSCLVGSYAS